MIRASGPLRLTGGTWARMGLTTAFGALMFAVSPWFLTIEDAAHQLLLAATLALGYLGLLLSFRAGFRPMLAVFVVFFTCWLVIPSMYQLSTNQVAWGDSVVLQAEPFTTRALLLNLVVLSIFIATYALHSGSDRIRPMPEPRDPQEGTLALLGLTLFLVCASATLLPLVVSSVGGIETVFATRSEASAEREAHGLSLASSGGALLALVSFVPAGLAAVALLLCAFMLSRVPVGQRPFVQGLSLLVLTGLSLALALIYANPLANTRFLALTTFGPALLLLWNPVRAFRGFLTVLVLFLAFLLFYPLAHVLQGSELTVETAIFAGPDFDGFQQIINSMLFVDGTSNSGGIYLLSALGFFIPRSVWEAKASPASLDVAAASDYSFINLSLPVHAEIHLEFGWIGVFLATWIVAWIWCRLDRAWLLHTSWRLLTAVLAMAQIGIMRGPLGAQVPVVAVAICTVLLVLLTMEAAKLRNGHQAADVSTVRQ